MTNNKYGSTASAIVWEKAARARKFKYEQQVKASKTQCLLTVGFAAVLVIAIIANVIAGLL